ncbi:peptidyl-tRNA hydrolase [Nakamurella lactea]|uniref:peptidyl-tRNA hydrolase n=1 Tax=Nakamurella lactea TaxID=459515 RepID=UPI0003F6B485|nr:peptidyl-tRNA hydrolase [Nakamurella lactea]
MTDDGLPPPIRTGAPAAPQAPVVPAGAAAPTGTALAPLRARYAHWLGLDEQQVLADRDEAAEDIRALQLLLRLERTANPSWHRALAMSATLSAAICLDPRSEPGGEWFDAVSAYCAGHIRKVTRRGRGAQWEATAELPGLTLIDGDTQVRAMLPGRVAELDKRISKLQVGGTELPVDDPVAAPPAPVLALFVPVDPPMTAGKQMAQTGHAGMIAAALLAGSAPPALRAWAAAGCPAVVRRADVDQYGALQARLATPETAWADEGLLAVRDAGFTEIAPGTVTVIARAPRN